jgi:DNA-binding transcriptional ArsR family regulator
MDTQEAIIIFDALSQETRLSAFRLLVKAGRKGLAAGEISEKLGTPHNTMSFHLSHLANAGIVSAQRQGRSKIYSVNFEAMSGFISFIVKDCCSDDIASVKESDKRGCSIIELTNCCE